jgi:hypothetical protein
MSHRQLELDWYKILFMYDLSAYATRVLIGGVLSLLFVVLCAALFHQKYRETKKVLFVLVTTISLSVTLVLSAVNFQMKSISLDNGLYEVNGHVRIFACGQEIPFGQSGSLVNRSLGDGYRRINHKGEMKFFGYRDANRDSDGINAFIESIGGSLTDANLSLPVGEEMISDYESDVITKQFIRLSASGENYLEFTNGSSCGDGTAAALSLYAYAPEASGDTYVQRHIKEAIGSYRFESAGSTRPNCVIIEFGKPATQTDKTCRWFPELKNVVYQEGSK